MPNNINITKLDRYELLKLALNKLLSYKNENPDEINKKYNFKHLPYEIEDLADLVFLRTYRPLHGAFPSSHYISNVNTMIQRMKSKINQFEKNKPISDAVINQLKEEINLSTEHANELTKLVYELLEEEPVAECLSQVALGIMKEGVMPECNLDKSLISIKLIESALKLSINDESKSTPPKRYAYLLAEIYANARKEFTGKIKFNAEKSLSYLKSACEYGSATAQGLMLEENPVIALLKANNTQVNEFNPSVIEGLNQLSIFTPNDSGPENTDPKQKNTNKLT